MIRNKLNEEPESEPPPHEDSLLLEHNAFQYLDRPPDAIDDPTNKLPRLKHQFKHSMTYRVHTQVGTTLTAVFPHEMTVYITTGLSLVDKDVLAPEMKLRI